jgi:hypothetical protein
MNENDDKWFKYAGPFDDLTQEELSEIPLEERPPLAWYNDKTYSGDKFATATVIASNCNGNGPYTARLGVSWSPGSYDHHDFDMTYGVLKDAMEAAIKLRDKWIAACWHPSAPEECK